MLLEGPTGLSPAQLKRILDNQNIVIPGGRLDLAMQLILTPMILQLMERSRRAGGGRRPVSPMTKSA